MNAQQLVKYQIIKSGLELFDEFASVIASNFPDFFDEYDINDVILEKLNTWNIDAIFDELEYDDAMQDGRSEVRCSGEEIDLKPTSYSRNYEVDAVAMNIKGVWVAWDYFYGGGKHSEPESIDWISNARIVSCTEKQVITTKRTFAEIED